MAKRQAPTHPAEVYSPIIQDPQKREIFDRIHIISQREDDWDGYGSKKPSELTLARAKSVIAELLDIVNRAGHLWLTPHITSDEDGYVTTEWYRGKRQLHLQIGEESTEYIQVWGTNIDTEMHVDFLNPGEFGTLWEWLNR